MSSRVEVHRALRLFLLLLAGCFVFEWGFASIESLRHAAYPHTSPLFDPTIRFSDWYDLLPRAAHFREPGFLLDPGWGLAFQYPLPCLYPFVVFVKLFAHPVLAYVVFTALVFFGATAAFSLTLHRTGLRGIFQVVTWATLLLGFPALFLVDRGNVEVFLWLAVVLGLVAFVRERPYAAAALFAIPACMKLYPALFLLLFLPRRQGKAFAFGILMAGLLFAAAVLGAGSSPATVFHDMAVNGKVLRDTQITPLARWNLRWDHSLLADDKQVIYLGLRAVKRASVDHEPTFERSILVYSVLAPLAFVALYFLRIRKLPLFNQLTALVLCALLFPYVSYEYTLVYLYMVWGCFLLVLGQDVSTGRLQISRRRLNLFAIAFALLVAPLTALAREQFEGQVKSALLLTLLFLTLTTPMPTTLFGDANPDGGATFRTQPGLG